MKRFLLSFLIALCAIFTVAVQSVSAGNNLSVVCTLTTCTSSPDAPLFNETNIWPGYSVTQQISAQNTTDQIGTFGLELIQSGNKNALANKIFVEIHQDSPSGTIVYGGGTTTLQNLYDNGNTIIGTLNPGNSAVYYIKAKFDPNAQNDVMGLSSVFNVNVGFNFTPVPSNPGNNSNPGGGGGGGGGSSTAGPTVCSDSAPVSAPILSFTESSTADGQVTLQWTSIPGANNYAINFGIQSGIYIYGNNNIGNQTSYTVTGLTPGNQYFFQVLGINGCAPGPRSNEISTGGNLLGAGTTVNAPNGFSSEQVLGVETEASDEATPSGDVSGAGDILGLDDIKEACQTWKPFLPVIMLAIQIVLSLIIYVLFRKPENRVKQVAVIAVILISTLIFYLLRNCDCGSITFLSVLCRWYIVLAVIAGLVTQFMNYALIEREE